MGEQKLQGREKLPISDTDTTATVRGCLAAVALGDTDSWSPSTGNISCYATNSASASAGTAPGAPV